MREGGGGRGRREGELGEEEGEGKEMPTVVLLLTRIALGYGM